MDSPVPARAGPDPSLRRARRPERRRDNRPDANPNLRRPTSHANPATPRRKARGGGGERLDEAAPGGPRRRGFTSCRDNRSRGPPTGIQLRTYGRTNRAGRNPDLRTRNPPYQPERRLGGSGLGRGGLPDDRDASGCGGAANRRPEWSRRDHARAGDRPSRLESGTDGPLREGAQKKGAPKPPERRAAPGGRRSPTASRRRDPLFRQESPPPASIPRRTGQVLNEDHRVESSRAHGPRAEDDGE